MRKNLHILLLILTFNFYGQNETYQSLLETYVHPESGYVFYNQLKSHGKDLDDYLNFLSSTPPKKSWSENKEKAYWINVYNANILKMIVEDYSSENAINDNILSLQKEGKSAWDFPFITIGSKKCSLNDVEHKIIREKFKDPRVHAAFNSASKSGCKVASFILTEDNVDLKLEQLMTEFINDKTKNYITANEIAISKIFDWYKDDFTIKEKNIIDYINKYSVVKVMPDAKIDFLQFNWILNDRL